jgi:peptidoglycan hydrolase-like protein with peptidoglycan-binding domain
VVRWRILGVLLVALACAGALFVAVPAQASTVPLDGRGMWIWELSGVDGGNLSDIAAGAQETGVRTVIIKSSDGPNMWEQFTPQLVQALHASGLRVCAWQYVYGNRPIWEADVGAQAVRDGADCLVIDAEVEYDGRYEQAQVYLRQLRKLIGYRFPVALAGLPYVDYHPAFPYSVFLGPGGAQYNMPQMYWFTIGTSVDDVYAHTYLFNRPYDRPIFPLGQVYSDPPASQIRRFRAVSEAYGAGGVSWWDWADATDSTWRALSTPVGRITGAYAPAQGMATVGKGAEGDLVVWAQEHLVAAGEQIAVDGDFGPLTLAATKRFQRAHGLAANGLINTATWDALLRYRAAHIVWTKNAAVAGGRDRGLTPIPENASLPDKRDELAGVNEAGYPHR